MLFSVDFFDRKSNMMAFQAWLVESDYGHGPSCSTTYHTVYSTVFDTFFEKRCSKVTAMVVVIMMMIGIHH